MFGMKDTKAETKAPMIGGSAAMMLKGMGIDTGQVEQIAMELIKAVQGVETRLAAIEASNARVEAQLDAVLVLLANDTYASE